MKIHKLLCTISLATIMVCALTGCSNGENKQNTGENSGPIIIGAGDDNNDTVGDVVKPDDTGTYGGTETNDKNSNSNTSNGDIAGADGLVETTDSVVGRWADIAGNVFDIVPDEDGKITAEISLIDSNTYYKGKCTTDEKTYISIDVIEGYENGETLGNNNADEEIETDENGDPIEPPEPVETVIKTVKFTVSKLEYNEDIGNIILALKDSKGNTYELSPYAPLDYDTNRPNGGGQKEHENTPDAP